MHQNLLIETAQSGCPPGRMRCPGLIGVLPPGPRASSFSMSSSPAKPSRARCLRSLRTVFCCKTYYTENAKQKQKKSKKIMATVAMEVSLYLSMPTRLTMRVDN